MNKKPDWNEVQRERGSEDAQKIIDEAMVDAERDQRAFEEAYSEFDDEEGEGTNSSNGGGASSADAAKIRHGIQAFMDKVINAHNPAMVHSFCSADYKEHQLFDDKLPRTRDGLKSQLT